MGLQTEPIRLRVGDAKLEDVAEGRARISQDVFRILRLKPGDMVRITGAHNILATAYPADSEDDGLKLLRIDGSLRRKAGVDLGGTVEVRRHEERGAERVKILALGNSNTICVSPEDVRAALAEKPVIAGDELLVAPNRRDFQAEVSILGLSLVGVVGSSAGADATLLRVIETTPGGVVHVTDDTYIEFLLPGEEADT
jgi:transitional endoplasmic reticulum ATPase